MAKPIKTFTDLLAWKEGHKLVLDIYKISKKFPDEEKFSLTNQIQRAVVSITSNIAEGFGRQTYEGIVFNHPFYCNFTILAKFFKNIFGLTIANTSKIFK